MEEMQIPITLFNASSPWQFYQQYNPNALDDLGWKEVTFLLS
jgi:hypothetical protein